MLKRIEDLNFYELLEVEPGATTQEVYRAYDRVKKVYDPNSVALYSLFTPDETAMLRQKIDEAYRTLSNDKNRKQYDTFLRERHELPEPEQIPSALTSSRSRYRRSFSVNRSRRISPTPLNRSRDLRRHRHGNRYGRPLSP